eukprot:1469004-Rhodomonas_salina.1
MSGTDRAMLLQSASQKLESELKWRVEWLRGKGCILSELIDARVLNKWLRLQEHTLAQYRTVRSYPVITWPI